MSRLENLRHSLGARASRLFLRGFPGWTPAFPVVSPSAPGRIVCAFLLSGVFAAAGWADTGGGGGEETVEGVIVCDTFVGVRAMERPDSLIVVRQLSCNQKVTIIDVEGDYVKIRINKHQDGFVPIANIGLAHVPVAPPPAPPAPAPVQHAPSQPFKETQAAPVAEVLAEAPVQRSFEYMAPSPPTVQTLVETPAPSASAAIAAPVSPSGPAGSSGSVESAKYQGTSESPGGSVRHEPPELHGRPAPPEPVARNHEPVGALARNREPVGASAASAAPVASTDARQPRDTPPAHVVERAAPAPAPPMKTAPPAFLPPDEDAPPPAAEVFAGFSVLGMDTGGLTADRQYLSGWNFGVSANITKRFAAEFDVSGYYKGVPGDNAHSGGGIRNYSYLAGPRFNFGPLFAHALIGGSTLRSEALGASDAGNRLTTALGGGAQFPVGESMLIRGGADFIQTRFDTLPDERSLQNNFRFSGGVVFSLGK
ncbi:MAG: hypothetical protein LBT74_02745 [Acidobacteriota bacterium]|jgi:hypothetical protein|nr:hypothetical protein [Acidobacteriota bacterium]